MSTNLKSFDTIKSTEFHGNVGLFLDRAYQRPQQIQRYSRDYVTILKTEDYLRLVALSRGNQPLSAAAVKTLG